ncbi:MAG TPA: hypothetical protein VK249_00840, partial [Anaerolineales bacterium]|nr:hypothetical protein [Anaerolineales bacterium]
FWLSLVPFVTGWMGENHFAQLPVALYGTVLWMAGLGYYFLTRSLLALHGTDSIIATALSRRIKEISSLVLYAAAVMFAFINTSISLGIYAFVALMWLIPDPRIEKTIGT